MNDVRLMKGCEREGLPQMFPPIGEEDGVFALGEKATAALRTFAKRYGLDEAEALNLIISRYTCGTNCPRCNKANPYGARFCTACGLPLNESARAYHREIGIVEEF